MEFRKILVDQTNAWAASSPVPLTITPQNNAYILGMILDLSVTKTDATPAYNQDGIWRLITGLQLGGGDNPYLAIGTDARLLYWWHRLRTRGLNRAPNYPAGNNSYRAILPILFGVNPVKADGSLNFEDVTAGVRRDQGLTLNVNWGAATALGTGITVTAATLQVELLLGILEAGDSPPPMAPNFVATMPQMQSGLGLAMTDPLPTNGVYRRTAIMINQGASPADNRTDGDPNTAVSEVGVKLSNGTVVTRWKTWDKARTDQSSIFVADDNGAVAGATLAPGVASTAGDHNPGACQVDWYEILASGAKNPYGLDTRNFAQAEVNLAYSVDNLTNTVIREFHERFVPQPA